jgi:nucleoside-diphosphate-sugar epimerase
MTRCLVVGGFGFLGSEVVRSLENAPESTVTIVDPNWFSVPAREGWIGTDAWALTESDLRGFDALIVLAALANDQVVEADLPRAFRDNAALPAYLGLAAKRAGVRRLVFASTTSVYETESERVGREEDGVTPSSPASVAKLQAELALALWRDRDFAVHVYRLGTLAGWSARPRLDLVLNTMCRDAVVHGSIDVRGPEVWRSIVGVEDAAFVMREAARGRFPAGTFNLVEGHYTLRELALAVRAAAAEFGLEVVIREHQAGVVRNFRASGEKVRALCGGRPWQRPRDLAAAVLRQLVALPREALADPRFSNVATFRASPPPAAARDA